MKPITRFVISSSNGRVAVNTEALFHRQATLGQTEGTQAPLGGQGRSAHEHYQATEAPAQGWSVPQGYVRGRRSTPVMLYMGQSGFLFGTAETT